MELLELLRAGARLHHTGSMEANEYRPDALVTEYLLTAAVLRAIVGEGKAARVEVLCRHTVNVMTSWTPWSEVRIGFGKRRVDILVGEPLRPEALVELKIGVRTGEKLLKDVDKLLATVWNLDKLTNPVICALMFEVFIEGTGKRTTAADFDTAFLAINATIEADLNAHLAADWPGRSLAVDLLERQVQEAEFDDLGVIDADGAASYICAAVFA